MRRSVANDCPKTVTVYDPVRRESTSFTVYTCGIDVAALARRIHDAMGVLRKTSLNSRRHKRR
jgi:hypothetical protein